jgi:dolichol-phosphate mannosyltransferase
MDNVHVIRRIGKRGLSSAVIDGFLAAKGNILVVMDADGQHDAGILLRLQHAIESGADIAVGSRYIAGGSVGNWDERRFALSRLATKLAMRLCRVRIHDPMSGFFAIKRSLFESTLLKLNPKGFKILLDFLVHVPKDTPVQEIPFTFGARIAGDSKLSRRVQMEFLEYLYDVTLGRYIPLLFVKYCIVGSLGVVVHLATYLIVSTFIRGHDVLTLFGFSIAVLSAVQVAILFNFILNNMWTFRHVTLRGFPLIIGFLKFEVACLFGAIANFAVSTYFYAHSSHDLFAAFMGAMVGVIWNYTMNRLFTWRDA